MDAHAIHIRFEVRKAIEFCLVCAPVVLMSPVVGEFFHVSQVGAIVPASPLDLIGPAGAGQAFAQIVKGGLGNGDFEWLDAHAFITPFVHVSVSTYTSFLPK